MRKITWSGPADSDRVNQMLPRAAISIEQALVDVAVLVEEVRTSGLSALQSHSEKFDGVVPVHFRVPKAELQRALDALDPELREAIETSITRVSAATAAALPNPVETSYSKDAIVSQRWQPVDSVGLYVPGGKAVYPSSVVMNVVAARTAGVPRIAIASPAQKSFDGAPHPTILATAELLGVDEVYAIGGASAIAAFAFGVSELELRPVRMVTGPGNIYVAAAKRLLRGKIGIDSEAGPTEILIIADESADPKLIAADLISQAEHDENAAAILVTDSSTLIAEVEKAVEALSKNTLNSERVIKALSGDQSALVFVENLRVAIEIANEYATEHLSIQTKDPEQLLEQISNAGAIFIGSFSPVSLGDYLAGSNHVLPTGEQAKFGPGLGAHTFLRPQQIINYSKSALSEVADQIAIFAEAEGLPAHGEAAKIRFH